MNERNGDDDEQEFTDRDVFAVREYLARQGRKGGEIGGKATGETKRRGNAAHYRALGEKSGAARKKRAKQEKQS